VFENDRTTVGRGVAVILQDAETVDEAEKPIGSCVGVVLIVVAGVAGTDGDCVGERVLEGDAVTAAVAEGVVAELSDGRAATNVGELDAVAVAVDVSKPDAATDPLKDAVGVAAAVTLPVAVEVGVEEGVDDAALVVDSDAPLLLEGVTLLLSVAVDVGDAV